MRLTDDAVQVYVEWANADTSPRASLIGAAAEVETESTTQRITQARVPITALNVVGALPGVSRVRLPDYPQLNAVTTQGDALQHLAALRTAASVDGTGITVGVI